MHLPRLVDEVVVLRFVYEELLLELRRGSGARAQLVEDVVVALLPGLECDARLFQQIVLDNRAGDLSPRVEADLNELPESAAVVIPERFCIP